jgi:hypothetical protein
MLVHPPMHASVTPVFVLTLSSMPMPMSIPMLMPPPSPWLFLVWPPTPAVHHPLDALQLLVQTPQQCAFNGDRRYRIARRPHGPSHRTLQLRHFVDELLHARSSVVAAGTAAVRPCMPGAVATGTTPRRPLLAARAALRLSRPKPRGAIAGSHSGGIGAGTANDVGTATTAAASATATTTATTGCARAAASHPAGALRSASSLARRRRPGRLVPQPIAATVAEDTFGPSRSARRWALLGSHRQEHGTLARRRPPYGPR